MCLFVCVRACMLVCVFRGVVLFVFLMFLVFICSVACVCVRMCVCARARACLNMCVCASARGLARRPEGGEDVGCVSVCWQIYMSCRCRYVYTCNDLFSDRHRLSNKRTEIHCPMSHHL